MIEVSEDANWNDLVVIIMQLRYRKKKWDREFGSANRASLKYWEDRADAWIKNYTHELHNGTDILPGTDNEQVQTSEGDNC